MRREHERLRRGGSGPFQFAVALGGGDGAEPPDPHEERVRFWWEPPQRLREEVETSFPRPQVRTTVIDGELWWLYSPDLGAISNAELDEAERARYGIGGGERLRSLLDPSGLIPALEFEAIERSGDRLHVRARPREDAGLGTRFQVPLGAGADAFELEVDGETGVVRRLTALLEGEEVSSSVLEELALDEEFPEGTFVLVPPPGEEVRPPEGAGERHPYTLEEAAAAAPFRLFAPPELPEGLWRLRVHFHEARRRPPTPALAALLYHRADARAALVISQRAADSAADVAWAGLGPPELEEVERGGVRYTVCRADPARGVQHGVAFEREGTTIQLQSEELDVETLLALATTLEPVGAAPPYGSSTRTTPSTILTG